MNRFFLPSDCIQAGEVHFPEQVSHQIAQVLRLKTGDEVIVLDNSGFEYPVEITQLNPRSVSGKVGAGRRAAAEPAARLTLYLGLTQREKFEWMLQKCTEIGAAGFVPVITSRSLVQSEKDVAGKFERWQRILCEAAEQCGRGCIPSLSQAVKFETAVQSAGQYPLALFLWEEEHSRSLRQALGDYLKRQPAGALRKAALFIGPEGGFSEQEASLAEQAGALPVSLGKRILRMETAALAATALTLYEFGEME